MITVELQTVCPDWPQDQGHPLAERCAAILGAEMPEVSGVIALRLTDDTEIQALNKSFRGKDTPTNVLSFPADPFSTPPGEDLFLGDIAIAYGVCAREAEARAFPLDRHLAHLMLHGFLHLLGYDHQSDADAAVMEDLEATLMDRLGYGNPYAGDEASS